jgi:hypothetical protein
MSALLFISKGTLFSKQTKHQNSSLHSYLGHFHPAIQVAALERVYISNSIHVVPLVAFKFKLNRFRGVVRAVDCMFFSVSIFAHGITPGFLLSSSSFADAKSEQKQKRRKKKSNALLLLLLLLRRLLEKQRVVIVIKQTREGNVAWVPDL